MTVIAMNDQPCQKRRPGKGRGAERLDTWWLAEVPFWRSRPIGRSCSRSVDRRYLLDVPRCQAVQAVLLAAGHPLCEPRP